MRCASHKLVFLSCFRQLIQLPLKKLIDYLELYKKETYSPRSSLRLIEVFIIYEAFSLCNTSNLI